MKIAVIGSGIVGYVASSYLSDLGHIVDCISPKINKISSSSNNEKKKFERPSPKILAERFFKK